MLQIEKEQSDLEQKKQMFIQWADVGEVPANTFEDQTSPMKITNQDEAYNLAQQLGLTKKEDRDIKIAITRLPVAMEKKGTPGFKTEYYKPSPYGITPRTQTEVEYKNDIADGKEVIGKNPGMRSQVFQRLTDKYPAKKSWIIRRDLGL